MVDIVTQFDDWSVWEALMMRKVKKGPELTVYNVFAQREVGPSIRTVYRSLAVIDLVGMKHGGQGLTNLSQTQVRYAMKKLVDKGLIHSSKQYKSATEYTAQVDRKLSAVARLQEQESNARTRHGSLDEMKTNVTENVMKLEKKLRKIKRLIAAAEHHQEIVRFDKEHSYLANQDV